MAGVVVVVAAGAIGAALATGAFRGSGNQPAGASSGYKTGTATVTRQSLTSRPRRTRRSATRALHGRGADVVVFVRLVLGVGGGGVRHVHLAAAGRADHPPGPGDLRGVRHPGGAAVRQRAGLPRPVRGHDRRGCHRAERDLVSLGYATAAALGPRSGWDYFSGETAYALELLQAKLGLTVTGTLPLGQAVFLPGATQVTGLGTGPSLGGPATAGTVVLTATSLTPVVTIDLDASLQTEVKVGDKVSITLPDGSSRPE